MGRPCSSQTLTPGWRLQTLQIPRGNPLFFSRGFPNSFREPLFGVARLFLGAVDRKAETVDHEGRRATSDRRRSPSLLRVDQTEQSKRNKVIRAMQKFPHTTGTKSFARFRAENVAEDKPEPSRAEVFIMTRTSRKNDYRNQVTTEAIAQINEAMSQLPEGAKDDPSPTDILSRVMGPDKYGRVRTYGMGVKPSNFFDAAPSRNELMAQNVILHGELDNLRSRVNQVEAIQVEKMRELEASAEKVNELQAQVNMGLKMD
ncbi:hypothetical protein EJ110_NYTH34629 [Nymphaea thermarum]|nr:hypothetical protein EJ110_NYTH34629 [Nymphaea thermarum]